MKKILLVMTSLVLVFTAISTTLAAVPQIPMTVSGFVYQDNGDPYPAGTKIQLMYKGEPQTIQGDLVVGKEYFLKHEGVFDILLTDNEGTGILFGKPITLYINGKNTGKTFTSSVGGGAFLIVGEEQMGVLKGKIKDNKGNLITDKGVISLRGGVISYLGDYGTYFKGGSYELKVPPGSYHLYLRIDGRGDLENPVIREDITIVKGNNLKDFVFNIKEQDECIDSDGGKNYYEVGRASLQVDASGRMIFQSDACAESNLGGPVVKGRIVPYLFEAVCENGKPIKVVYKCPNGCLDGKCIGKKVTQPINPTPNSISHWVSSILAWIKDLFANIFTLSITGPQTIEPNTLATYKIDIPAPTPDSNYNDGTYQVQWANWALIDKNGNILKQGQWEKVNGRYYKTISITTPSSIGDYVLVGMITQFDMTFNFETGKWSSSEEKIINKEAIDLKTGYKITEPEVPIPSGFQKFINSIINFFKNLFGI